MRQGVSQCHRQTSSGVQLAVSKWRSRVRSRCAEGARRRYHPSVLIQRRFQMFWITQKLAGARLLREQGPCRSASSRPSQNTSCDLRRRISACIQPSIAPTTGSPSQATRPREQVGGLFMVRPHTYRASAANGHDALLLALKGEARRAQRARQRNKERPRRTARGARPARHRLLCCA